MFQLGRSILQSDHEDNANRIAADRFESTIFSLKKNESTFNWRTWVKAGLAWLGFLYTVVIGSELWLQIPGLGEGFEAAVVGFLDLVREAAAGQLLRRQVITYALTAHSLLITTGI